LLHYHSFKIAQLALVGVSLGLVWNSFAPLARELRISSPAVDSAPPVLGGELAQGERYAVIQSRNLFQGAAPVAPPVEETLEASKLDVKLLGTVEAWPPERSVGIVQDSGGGNKVRVVRAGELVAEGRAKVVRIEQRKLVVEHEGRLEAIETEKTRSVQTVSRDREALRTRIDERRALQESMSQVSSAEQVNQAGAQMDADFSALVVQNISPGSGLSQLGLRPRDRIVAIDGIPMGQGISLPQLLLSFGESTAKVLEIERDGGKTQVSIPAERVLEVIQELGEKP
jgi:type II secretion system protein C